MDNKKYFESITLLITHYNRSGSLRRLLEHFQKLNCVFGDVVVSDDGSRPEHLNSIKNLQNEFPFRLITTPKNKGLGNNINKGQDAVNTPYTLYVQEDFVPKAAFPQCLQTSVDFMEERSDLDMVRYYAYFKYPFLKPYKNGFSEMSFDPRPWYWGYKKFYVYSDHPHLRRSSFFEKFGRYTEGTKGDETEYNMMMSFLINKGKALYYNDFRGLFDQENSVEEPSTMRRNYWRETNNFIVKVARHFYRHFKFNYDFHFKG